MKVTVEVPEGHTVKIVKDEESMQPAQKAAGGVNLNLKVKHSYLVM